MMENCPEHYEVEYVFGKQMDKNGEINYAVKWLGYDKKQYTWEPVTSFSDASIFLINRFEKLLSYRNYYKFIARKIEKVKTTKGPDEPIRMHIKEAEYINIELETQETAQKPDEPQVKDQEPDVYIVGVTPRPVKPTDTRDINRIRQERVSHLTDYNKFNQLRTLGNQLNPILKSTPSLIKSKFKLEKDYLNEIIFEQRQKEKEQNIGEVSEIKDKKEVIIPLKVVSDATQSETITQQEHIFMDSKFKPIVLSRALIEMIISHHLHKNDLWFKCQCDSEDYLYVDFRTLQQYYSTLLLDYISHYSVLI